MNTAWPGLSWVACRGVVRQGKAGSARQGLVLRGQPLQGGLCRGSAGASWLGADRQVQASLGAARHGLAGRAWCGAAWPGAFWLGSAPCVRSGRGAAGAAGDGRAVRVASLQGCLGAVRQARLCSVRLGEAARGGAGTS